MIRFVPKNDTMAFIKKYGDEPSSLTGAKGEFDMVISGATGPTQGLPPGEYKVVILMVESAKKKQIPERYQDWQTTPWEFSISSSGKTDLVLKLDPK